MRVVAEMLLPECPLTDKGANHILEKHGCFYGSVGGHQTLERLELRGIATRSSSGWVRGPFWKAAAVYYGWKDPFKYQR